jgi:alkylation response protein AidB-like acyl-CoA dehydrogenase
MATVVEEVGTMVAENVAEILRSADGAQPAPSQSVWGVLADGGWQTISADPENGMELREILEVARVTGRFPYSTPLVPTLLAGRWFDLDEDQLARGIVPVLRRGSEAVAPYYTEGVTVLDGTGSPVTADPASTQSFSLLAPVAVFAEDTVGLSGGQLAEARAAFAAVAVGAADAVIIKAVEWAQTREQFGQKIKGFQAVRHHLANAHIAREQAWTAAIAAAHEPENAGRWAHQAFALARTAIELGIQVHGGVGFTWEVGLQHFLDHVIELDSLLGENYDRP